MPTFFTTFACLYICIHAVNSVLHCSCVERHFSVLYKNLSRNPSASREVLLVNVEPFVKVGALADEQHVIEIDVHLTHSICTDANCQKVKKQNHYAAHFGQYDWSYAETTTSLQNAALSNCMPDCHHICWAAWREWNIVTDRHLDVSNILTLLDWDHLTFAKKVRVFCTAAQSQTVSAIVAHSLSVPYHSCKEKCHRAHVQHYDADRWEQAEATQSFNRRYRT